MDSFLPSEFCAEAFDLNIKYHHLHHLHPQTLDFLGFSSVMNCFIKFLTPSPSEDRLKVECEIFAHCVPPCFYQWLNKGVCLLFFLHITVSSPGQEDAALIFFFV